MQFLDLLEEESFHIPKADFDVTTALTLHHIHGNKISVEFPTPLNNQSYVLRSRGYVGQIPVTDDLVMRINSKVPVDNLFRMLEYAYNLKSFDFLEGHISVESLDDLFERLAAILAKKILNRARKGLYRGYVGEQESLPYLRGRVLVMPSVRSAMRGSTRLECEYEEHTADLDDNHILAWTLYRLPRFRLQRDEVRRQVRQAYRVLARTVEVTSVEAKDCVRRLYHRLNEDYRPMHGLCRFFLEHCGPGVETGEHDFIPFVLNMPSLFESFVAEWLRANLPAGMRVTPQYRADLDDSGMFAFRIDLVLRNVASDQVIAVMDTKYKREERPEEADIQQIVAYAVRMKTKDAFLIYPSSVTQSRVLLVGDDIRVQNLIFDVGKDPDEAGRLFLGRLNEALAS
jgi:5-methylcytosine-specific restriction enzyme subunit McrC